MEEVFSIAPADLDLAGSAMVTRLLDRMQKLADVHANVLGVGRDDLSKVGLVWMSARSVIVLERELREGERITLYTWTCENTHAACSRYFDFCDEKGLSIGSGATLWMLIDPKTRHIVSAQKAGVLTGQVILRPAPAIGFQRLAHVSRIDAMEIRKPKYTDLDINGHVNNVIYANWILDALPLPLMRQDFVDFLQINYHQEIQPDDTCRLEIEMGENEILVCGRSEAGGRFFFEAGVQLKRRN